MLFQAFPYFPDNQPEMDSNQQYRRLQNLCNKTLQYLPYMEGSFFYSSVYIVMSTALTSIRVFVSSVLQRFCIVLFTSVQTP